MHEVYSILGSLGRLVRNSNRWRDISEWHQNHQKYNWLMEQPRVNWDRGRHEVNHCEILVPNIGELVQSAWSASELSIALWQVSFLISFHNALSIRCTSTIIVYLYVTEFQGLFQLKTLTIIKISPPLSYLSFLFLFPLLFVSFLKNVWSDFKAF